MPNLVNLWASSSYNLQLTFKVDENVTVTNNAEGQYSPVNMKARGLTGSTWGKKTNGKFSCRGILIWRSHVA